VTELQHDDDGRLLAVDLQAVLTGRSERLDWRRLQDPQRWQMGWK